MEASPQAESSPHCEPTLKAPRKRKRIIISCTECHRRKQKCDRTFPCANCIARNKQSLCAFDNEVARKQALEEARPISVEETTPKPLNNGTAQIAALGYAKAHGDVNTTLGIFKKIESHVTEPSAFTTSHTTNTVPEYSSLRERYKSMIRQLPSKSHIDKLLVTFFQDYNPGYYPLDEAMFRDLHKQWNHLPFRILNRGPQELHPDLQFFPALLFQVLALALQFVPSEHDPSLDNLKYAAAMTLDDLATDYSESGVAILSLLGQKDTTLITVQAGFLRCSYLKNCGLITESWHFLTQTIRAAQEISLYQITTNHQARRPEDVIGMLWVEQLRRRVWMLLSLWDIRMAMVLGRTASIDVRNAKPPLPIDAPIPKNRHEVVPAPRSPSDPPTALTVLLWNAELASPLWDIASLEKEGPRPQDFSRVERMHKLLNHVDKQCPAFFRSHNPDTSFDSLCDWLPKARATFQSLSAFNIMALHRPYLFTKASSRTSALKAAIEILRAQRMLFEMIGVHEYKMHCLVLNTFDAIVLAAAVYTIHPLENRDHLDETLQHFEWSMERIEALTVRNRLAQSALDVLKAIQPRFTKAISANNQQHANRPLLSPSASPPVLNPRLLPHHSEVLQNEGRENESLYPPPSTGSHSSIPYPFSIPTISPRSHNQLHPSPESWDANTSNPHLQDVDFSNVGPLQPLHDILYNDLGTLNHDYTAAGAVPYGMDAPMQGKGGEVETDNPASWLFEGDFGSDSFWGFMNHWKP